MSMNNKLYIRIMAALIAFAVCAALTFANSNTRKNRKHNNNDCRVIIDASSKETNDNSLADSSEYTGESSSQPENLSSVIDSSAIDSVVESVVIESIAENSTPEEIQVITSETVTDEPAEVIIVEEPNVQIIEETIQELGDPIEESQPQLVEDTPKEVLSEEESSEPDDNYMNADYEPYELYNQGRLYWGNYEYTWYSERVLPGYGLAIDGRHTDSDGFVCDEDGYICVASGSLSKGTVVDTPFGRQGKVYDCGCPANVLDCYVNW